MTKLVLKRNNVAHLYLSSVNHLQFTIRHLPTELQVRIRLSHKILIKKHTAIKSIIRIAG